MPSFSNFFETLKEAHMRLLRTVVLYDKTPCHVIAITDHMKDGIFRIYLEPIGFDTTVTRLYPSSIPNYNTESTELGGYIDGWMTENPTSKILRKQMNSPLFNKYRPFPLGMVNQKGNVFYVERQPTRSTWQGLTKSAIDEKRITLGEQVPVPRGLNTIDFTGEAFRDCIVGSYPDPDECLKNLLSDDYENDAVAFDRSFAFVRGPIGMVFLAYKGDIVGVLPNGTKEPLRLGKGYRHVREVAEALKFFGQIITQ